MFANVLMSLTVVAYLALQAGAVFALAYLGARLAIRHERRREGSS